MELQGERLIPASVEKTWAALNDPDVLKACIAGCESVERTGDDWPDQLSAGRLGAGVAIDLGQRHHAVERHRLCGKYV